MQLCNSFAGHAWNLWAKRATMCTLLPLSDALAVPIRVVYLDCSSCGTSGGISVNHHDMIPTVG
uniref:Uncharacterized protein n=1 Tax=Rhizophora mucronata TaxID=61149 RepID=A0A2P2K8F1_RHIMU